MATKEKEEKKENLSTEEKPKKTTRKKRVTKKVTQKNEEEAQEAPQGVQVLETEEVEVVEKQNISPLNDDGSLNENSIVLSKNKEKYTQIMQALKEDDLSTVSSFGESLNNAMGTYSSDMLNRRINSDDINGQTALLSNLLGQFGEVDVDDFRQMTPFKKFISHIPILKSFVKSLEQIKLKYNTIEKNIDEIVKKLEASRLRAINDNNSLQKIFDNNLSYIQQMEDLIVAGRLKLKELDAEIDEMENGTEYVDQWKINGVKNYYTTLEKRVSDLFAMQFAFKQTLFQIQIIQQTNAVAADNTKNQIAMAIPLWKNSLSLAVSLYNQKEAIKANKMVSDTTNELLRKNSEMMKTQAIEVTKQNQRSIIDAETLAKTTKDLIETVQGVRKATEEGIKKRRESEIIIKNSLEELKKSSASITDSTKLIVAKELRGLEDYKHKD